MTMRQVILHRGEDGYWVAEVQSLPGCISQGQSKEESLRNIQQAIQEWEAAAASLGRPIPPEEFHAQVVVIAA